LPGPAPADPPISAAPARAEPDEHALRRRDRRFALSLMAASALVMLFVLAGLWWVFVRPA